MAKRSRHLLHKDLAGGGEKHDGGAVGRLGRIPRLGVTRRGIAQDCLHGLKHRLRLEHHALAAAERAIVHGLVAVVSELPQIVHANIDQAGLSGSADNAVVERSGEELREDGDDVKLHRLAKARATLISDSRMRLHRIDCKRGGKRSGRVQVAQALGQAHLDSPSCRINLCADFRR